MGQHFLSKTHKQEKKFREETNSKNSFRTNFSTYFKCSILKLFKNGDHFNDCQSFNSQLLGQSANSQLNLGLVLTWHWCSLPFDSIWSRRWRRYLFDAYGTCQDTCRRTSSSGQAQKGAWIQAGTVQSWNPEGGWQGCQHH